MQAMNYHKYVFVPTPVRSEVPASVSHNEDLTTSCSSGAGGGVQTGPSSVPREALFEATDLTTSCSSGGSGGVQTGPSSVPCEALSEATDLTTSCSSGAGGGVQTVPREALSEATVNGIKTEPNAPSAAAADNRGSACTQESKTDKV